MVNKKEPLEWTFEESPQEWPALPDAPQTTPAMAVPHSAWHEWRLAALIALCCVLVVGGWLWRSAPSEHQPPKATVTSGALEELQILEPDKLWMVGPRIAEVASRAKEAEVEAEWETLRQTIQEGAEGAEIINPIELLDYRDEIAIVEVTLYDAGAKQSFRQMRAYRRAWEKWYRLTSPGDVWGAWQTLETAHFRIRYRPIDAATVMAEAPQLDRLYNELRADFGVPLTATVPTITLEVVTEIKPGLYGLDTTSNTIQVTSPSLLSVPVEMAAATKLRQMVVYPLSSLVLAQSAGRAPRPAQPGYAAWRRFALALRLWAMWEATPAQRFGRAEIVRWLYQNGQGTPVGSRQSPNQQHRNERHPNEQPLDVELQQRCRTYPSWEVSLTALEILLNCKARLSPWREPAVPTTLGSDLFGLGGEMPPDEGELMATIAVETMIEYVVATYGRDELPRLVAAVATGDSWQNVIPALFATSTAAFEQEWQRYLLEHYGAVHAVTEATGTGP